MRININSMLELMNKMLKTKTAADILKSDNREGYICLLFMHGIIQTDTMKLGDVLDSFDAAKAGDTKTALLYCMNYRVKEVK